MARERLCDSVEKVLEERESARARIGTATADAKAVESSGHN